MLCNECVARTCSSFCKRNRILRNSNGDIPMTLLLEDGELHFTVDITYNGEVYTHSDSITVDGKISLDETLTKLGRLVEQRGKQLSRGFAI